MNNKSIIPVSDEIWSLIRETQKNLKEISISHKKAQEEMKELRVSQKATEEAADKQMKKLRISQEAADKQMKELRASQKATDKQMKESAKRFEKTRALFETQWGRLVESLVEGKLVEMLKARGIEVRQTSQRVEVSYTTKEGKILKREFDILVVNGTEVVAVEVKTTLTPDKVKYFVETLKDFKKYFPDHQSKTIYGAVAYLKSESEAQLYAQRQGLFVIKATGDSASIINPKDFKPKIFA